MQQLAGSKRSGNGIPEGTGVCPGIKMILEWHIVVWGGTGAGDRGGVGGSGHPVGSTRNLGTGRRIGKLGRS